MDWEALREVMPLWALRRIPKRYRTDDAVVISSAESRSQSANREDCVTKLRAVVTAALRRPRARRKTKPSRGAVERRLESKRQRSQRKQSRRASRDPQD